MKRSDVAVVGVIVVVLLPFFLFPSFLAAYKSLNAAHGYLVSFAKFAILATFGECLGLRIRSGVYHRPGFGLVPRAFVWGFLGVVIKIAFVIFGEGAPVMLRTMGVGFPDANPADILRHPEFSMLKFWSAFSVSVTMNLLFAPVFMAFHRVTDTHIQATGGTIRGFLKPLPVGRYFREIDWPGFWDFVLVKTIPLFWIPAQAINFLFPEDYRILIAALYSIVLGVLLSLSALMQKKKQA
jgi:hypothetical protein